MDDFFRRIEINAASEIVTAEAHGRDAEPRLPEITLFQKPDSPWRRMRGSDTISASPGKLPLPIVSGVNMWQIS
jgi:hypothetical protein